MKDKVERIAKAIDMLLENKDHILLAIDGRCAAGKTTLAARLGKQLNCNVLHMDDFFLRPEQRTEERLQEPGGNVDYERFLQEVLLPLRTEQTAKYRPFDCKTQALLEPVFVPSCSVNIIEGSYSCHPTLWKYYDLHVFLTVESDEQLRRITQRNGADIEAFRNKWIPLEEQYFRVCQIEEHCELKL